MQQKNFLGQSHLGFHRVAYTEWGAATAQPPVICVHGLTRNGRDFDRLAEQLQNRTRVLCPDIAGRGKSDWLADPMLYAYPQYLADMTALIARADAASVDWVGTSMGGLIGMMLAAQPNTPIRRLVINDIGPFIALEGLQRIGTYVSQPPEFATPADAERYIRTIFAPFGITRDEDWQHMLTHSCRTLPGGKLALAYDPAIGKNVQSVTGNVDLWTVYDAVRCPTLILRGTFSDILPAQTAEEMTRRGPKARLVTIPNVGHAPALLDEGQTGLVADFLS
jgi:pimeloyl-ACP methyl ester carboxylesterase